VSPDAPSVSAPPPSPLPAWTAGEAAASPELPDPAWEPVVVCEPPVTAWLPDPANDVASPDPSPAPLLAVDVAVLVERASPVSPPTEVARLVPAPVPPEVARPVPAALAAPLVPPVAEPVTAPVLPDPAVTAMPPLPPDPVSPVSPEDACTQPESPE
jgi:hypothetical protein